MPLNKWILCHEGNIENVRKGTKGNDLKDV
jgi:hypothetical protein